MSTLITTLPALGQPMPGHSGTSYAGILTSADGRPYILLLLDEQPAQPLDWQAAMDWAATVGADLPTQPELAHLYATLQAAGLPWRAGRAPFDEDWHWSNETARWSTSSARSCYFSLGYLTTSDKSTHARARAVRRLPLQSFDASTGTAGTEALPD